jgi:hypothetical protein
MIPPLFGKQEVGIWWVQKCIPQYGVPIWSLWPNIRSLPSIVAEKNATKNVHIQMYVKNYWWQKSDIWSQASYRYPISWEAFFDPSDSCFLFAEERGFHKWALAHSSSCYLLFLFNRKRQAKLKQELAEVQLPMQSVPITTLVEFESRLGEVYSIQHYVIKFVSDLRKVVVFSRYSVCCFCLTEKDKPN